MVGFPYSIYGSVRYSQHLTQKIEEMVTAAPRHISMGEVSYIAHSLHLFLDDYGQNIARAIVDAASV